MDLGNGDGTRALCLALYGREPKPQDYLGGADAKMIWDAAAKLSNMKAAKRCLTNMIVCLTTWERNSCIIGNLTAGEMADSVSLVLANMGAD